MVKEHTGSKGTQPPVMRRAALDRRVADLPFEGPDRRKAPGGIVVEIHKDAAGVERRIIKRKRYLDRRQPAAPGDHQR